MSLRTGDETLRLMLDILHEHQRIKLCIYKITERINLGINCYHHLITIYPFTCKVCSFCRHFLHLTVKYLRNPPFKVNQVSAAAEGFLLMMGIILLLLFLSIFHLKNVFMTLWTNKMSIIIIIYPIVQANHGTNLNPGTHVRAPEKGFWRHFTDELNQKFSSICATD